VQHLNVLWIFQAISDILKGKHSHGNAPTLPRTAAGLRFVEEKAAKFGRLRRLSFYSPTSMQERCNLPRYVACQKEADDSQNHNDSCCHCTPSRSKFRHFSMPVSFEEQPPVLSDFSYDCADLYSRNIFSCC
jgi:hypothetical protein